MTKFLLAVRKAYDTKRIAFVIAFCAVAVFLYFAPNCLCTTVAGYLGLFGNWLIFASLGYIDFPSISQDACIALSCIGIIFFIAAITGVVLSTKYKPLISLVLPLSALALALAIQFTPYAELGYDSWLVYSAFYIIVCLLVILAVVLILLATYLPLKEPAPAEPKPERKRKPSKAERIAELEARVRELEDKERGSN